LHFLKNSFFQESDRHILWAPVFFGCGIYLYFTWSYEPPLSILYLIGGSSIFFGIGCVVFKNWRFLWGALFLITLGWGVAHSKAYRLDTVLIHKNYFVPNLEAEVAEVEEASYGKRVVLNVFKTPMLPSEVRKVKVTLRGHKDLVIKPGDIITAPVKLVPINDSIVPGGFDFQKKAFFQGISASGYIMGEPKVQPTKASSIDLYIASVRHHITTCIRKSLPGEIGGIAAALITGDRAGISQKTQDHFADAGIAHVLAISGLHLSLVGGLLFFVIRSLLSLWPRVALSYDIKKGAAVIAFIGVFLYLNISGASTPTRRAFLMSALMMLAVLLDRAPLSMRLVSAAAVGVLFITPEALMTPSFQLSFAAVVALIAAYENMSFERAPEHLKGGKLRGYIGGVLMTTLVASLATVPFTIYHFHKFTLQSLTANLLVIPLVGFWIMPAGVLSVLLMPIGFQDWPLQAMGMGIALMEKIAGEVSQWPGASILVTQVPGWGFGSMVMGGLWLCLWKQKWRWGGAGLFMIGTLSFLYLRPPNMIVSSNAKMVGACFEDKLFVSGNRLHTFTTDGWARWLGVSKENIRKWNSPEGQGHISCKENMCSFTIKGHTILFLKDLPFLPDLSKLKADILISARPLENKKSLGVDIVIDFFDLWRKGTYAFWIQENKVSYITSRDISGQRPWSKIYKRDLKRSSV
jgi:competence protein ComEC